MKTKSCLCIVAAVVSSFPIYYELCGDDNSDLDMTTPDMIKREGYQVEEHVVTTEDGYLLTLHRIPGTPGAPTVFVQHGLLSNSFDWVVTGRQKGLAFILANYGYDVWMGNARGNTYSRRHANYSTSDPRFWNFSWHEMGIYDLPAEITYITNLKNDSLIYIGHSMGTTMFYVMAIERPDIAAKVKVMISFAPVAFTYNIRSPIKYVSPTIYGMETLNDYLGIFQLLPQSRFVRLFNKYGCEMLLNQNNFCAKFIFALAGYNEPQFNYTLLPLILSHTPAGTSMKTFYHYLQTVNTGKFQYYDYGAERNLALYSRADPPEYDLSKIQVPIGIFWSENDVFSHPLDVKKFYDAIPRKIFNYKIQNTHFSHIDYMWAIDAPKLIYSKLVSFIELHSQYS